MSRETMQNEPVRDQITVWAFRDGRAGHQRQVDGLIQGLKWFVPIEEIPIEVAAHSCSAGGLQWSVANLASLPQPDLLVGAGHATHVPILSARLLRGGRSVVLMKPSLPCSWFDMVLLPEHDRNWSLASVVFTRGVLGPTHKGIKDPRRGVILLGGTSRHLRWTLDLIAEHVAGIIKTYPDVEWDAYSSRRTPETTLNFLHSRFGIAIHRHEETSSESFSRKLSRAAYAWVTADSVSMLHEAVASRARVGALMLPLASGSRKILRGIEYLARRNSIALSTDGYVLDGVVPHTETTSENQRVARRVLRDLLSSDWRQSVLH